MNYGSMGDKEKNQLVQEVNILREMKHPNIVRYVDRIIEKDKTQICIVMEYCEKGDIGQLIKNQKRRVEYIPESLLWKIIGQIAGALEYCHSRKNKILH